MILWLHLHPWLFPLLCLNQFLVTGSNCHFFIVLNRFCLSTGQSSLSPIAILVHTSSPIFLEHQPQLFHTTNEVKNFLAVFSDPFIRALIKLIYNPWHPTWLGQVTVRAGTGAGIQLVPCHWPHCLVHGVHMTTIF